jgi:WD40 repeat protein
VRPFQSASFSLDGQYLAAGESAFSKPEITIWGIIYQGDTKKVEKYNALKFLKGHKFGIEALKFSPDSKYLVSLGDQNDKGLFVWDWKEEKKVCQNKLSKPVLALAFSPNQDFFVTGGYQHLKYWYMDEST